MVGQAWNGRGHGPDVRPWEAAGAPPPGPAPRLRTQHDSEQAGQDGLTLPPGAGLPACISEAGNEGGSDSVPVRPLFLSNQLKIHIPKGYFGAAKLWSLPHGCPQRGIASLPSTEHVVASSCPSDTLLTSQPVGGLDLMLPPLPTLQNNRAALVSSHRANSTSSSASSLVSFYFHLSLHRPASVCHAPRGSKSTERRLSRRHARLGLSMVTSG